MGHMPQRRLQRLVSSTPILAVARSRIGLMRGSVAGLVTGAVATMAAMKDELNPIWVDTPGGVEAVAAAAAEDGRLAVDTEADSLHSYYHKVCLIQVTAAGDNFVIDPLALVDGSLAPLWKVMEDPRCPVLMHGADYDIRVLDRDYGVRIRGLVDTQLMAQVLGEPKTGLASLLEAELGVVLDKKFQRADWGRRPLKAAQVAYAAADTAFLADLAGRLERRLDELGRTEWAKEEFARLEKVRHRQPEPDPLAFERVKGVRALKKAARNRAFSLFEWRERTAQSLDIPPFKVLGNKPLVDLAATRPKNGRELVAVSGIGPRFARRWGDAVIALLADPDRAPERCRRERRPELAAGQIRRLKRLAAVRDEVAAELFLDPGLLCPKACLTAAARQTPQCASLDDLRDAGLIGWRLDVLGERFLTAVDEEG